MFKSHKKQLFEEEVDGRPSHLLIPYAVLS